METHGNTGGNTWIHDGYTMITKPIRWKHRRVSAGVSMCFRLCFHVFPSVYPCIHLINVFLLENATKKHILRPKFKKVNRTFCGENRIEDDPGVRMKKEAL